MSIESYFEGNQFKENEMLDVSIDYWFSDHDEIRSPFPDYIKSDLRGEAIDKFMEWTSKLSVEARKEINDEILLERFEEILFECANKMVISDDEKITIKYPFILRVGDTVKDHKRPESIVTAREICQNGDEILLKIKLKECETNEIWDTTFELPA